MTRVVDLDDLTISQRDELGAALREEARRLRRTLTEEQAWGAFGSAPLKGTGWVNSRYADIGRIRIAVRQLMTLDRWESHQIIEPMMAVALHVCPDSIVARLAVEAGIEDARMVLGNCRGAS